MLILTEKIPKEKLNALEELGESEVFFEDMVKCVVDIEKELLAINAELHAVIRREIVKRGSQELAET
ncbi:MAG: DUF5674 family protein [Clostridiales bacterium]|nr:DUF5674 family protein [Clostridiales bacterium]